MKKLAFALAIFPLITPAQDPAYHDPGMKVVTQVAIVCRDIEAASKRWATMLGVDQPQIHTTKPGHEVKLMYRGRPVRWAGKARLYQSRTGHAGTDPACRRRHSLEGVS